ncbi:MAG: enoyl-CoA hydratase-related protein [Firmicutes bacterium]|nr:enoyl-CoA hydratase-related protein [Bacillota bacterium]
MAGEAVLLRREGPVAEVVLNNPGRHNALSGAVLEGLHRVVAALAVDRQVRAVFLHGGEARAFCAGADLKERAGMTEAEVYATVHRLRKAVNGVYRLPVPVIAAIHGGCYGGGLELALACDIRLAAEDAELGLTELSWAIIPGAGGTQRLARLVGPGRARELIFTAARVGAAEAERIGLVNRVVPRAELLPAARAMAARIAEMGPVAVRAAKKALNAADALGEGLALEWQYYQETIPTRDRLEGLRAFAEKRKPEYRGE